MIKFDVAIIGSGLAGLTVALNLAEKKKVVIISKGEIKDGATRWAQGGIAAALDFEDSLDKHITDTIKAGAGLCDLEVTQKILSKSEEAINWLISQGVIFTEDSKSKIGLHFTREAGHSNRRIIHSGDSTGDAVQTTLETKVRNHPNISILEYYFAIDLITLMSNEENSQVTSCYGLYVQNLRTKEVVTVSADHTVLATGGAGKVYLYTTNPDTATGDGVAMAWRAGCRVANMEFIQFHPTCLYHPFAKSFLVSESVRGEGGVLKLPLSSENHSGKEFMSFHHEQKELAPRDIVARAIDFEMKKRGLEHVDLDISHKPSNFLKKHFPTIFSRCFELGIDITKQPIPVVPATHYICGGIVTDIDGCTDINRLYAVGETAYTGLHGANRLASNSLLECIVTGKATSEKILKSIKINKYNLNLWDESRVSNADEEVVITQNWDELRRFMWNFVGIVRTTKRLERAQNRIILLKEEIDEYYANFRITSDLLELRNLVEVASLIVKSALARRESRGLHFSLDFPETFSKALPTVLTPRVKKKRKNLS